MEMQRKLDKLENVKQSQARKIKKLQHMLATAEGQGDCCCEELRHLHKEKEDNLNRIADTWKHKTYMLANDYQKKLQGVRDEN